LWGKPKKSQLGGMLGGGGWGTKGSHTSSMVKNWPKGGEERKKKIELRKIAGKK